jgi:hypothetical protein
LSLLGISFGGSPHPIGINALEPLLQFVGRSRPTIRRWNLLGRDGGHKFATMNSMKRQSILACATLLGLIVLLGSRISQAGPMYMFPKNVEPKITSFERKSGFRVTKKEWQSLQVQTTVWEIAQMRPPKGKLRIGEIAPVVTIVKQRSFGVDRRFDYVANSGLAVTVEHPRGKAKSTAYTIEKEDSFLDGFRLTENDEVDPFSDDEIAEIKRLSGAESK